jgi:septation ring formation regulator EzrA
VLIGVYTISLLPNSMEGRTTMWRVPLILACLFGLSCASSGRTSGRTSDLSPGRALGRARAALATNHLADALPLYAQVLASSRASMAQRGEALYYTSILHTLPDPALRDLNDARSKIVELQNVRHERWLEIGSVRALLDERQQLLDQSAAADAQAKATLTARDGEIQTLRRALDDSIRDTQSASERASAVEATVQTTGDQLTTLRRDNARLRSELSASQQEVTRAREELIQKDEALKRVAQTAIRLRKQQP